jgi:hypothetical protein
MLISHESTISHIQNIIEEYNNLHENSKLKDQLKNKIRIVEDLSDRFNFIALNFYPEDSSIHEFLQPQFDLIEEDLREISNSMHNLYQREQNWDILWFIISTITFGIVTNSTKIQIEKESAIKKLHIVSEKVATLVKELYGKAIQFRKNTVGCKIWIICNGQDKDTLAINIFIDNIISFLQEKYLYDYQMNKTIYDKSVKLFAHKLDGIIGGKPDKLISINELQYATKELPEKYTLKEVLGLDHMLPKHYASCSYSAKEYRETDEQLTSTIIDNMYNGIKQVTDTIKDTYDNAVSLTTTIFNSNKIQNKESASYINSESIHFPSHNLTQSYNDKIILHYTEKNAKAPEFKDCREYGMDISKGWLIKEILTDSTPLFEVQRMIITFQANYKSKGKSNHSSVRYKINNSKPELIYFLDKEVCPDGNYVYQTISKIEPDSTITLYLCCPDTNGNEACIEDITIRYSSA